MTKDKIKYIDYKPLTLSSGPPIHIDWAKLDYRDGYTDDVTIISYIYKLTSGFLKKKSREKIRLGIIEFRKEIDHLPDHFPLEDNQYSFALIKELIKLSVRYNKVNALSFYSPKRPETFGKPEWTEELNFSNPEYAVPEICAALARVLLRGNVREIRSAERFTFYLSLERFKWFRATSYPYEYEDSHSFNPKRISGFKRSEEGEEVTQILSRKY